MPPIPLVPDNSISLLQLLGLVFTYNVPYF